MKSQANMFYAQLETRFVAWAQMVEDIRAAFIVGSRARDDHPADDWSDMDIVFLSPNRAIIFHRTNGLKTLGISGLHLCHKQQAVILNVLRCLMAGGRLTL